jgi:FAD/FMN-containing dehydrogenase
MACRGAWKAIARTLGAARMRCRGLGNRAARRRLLRRIGVLAGTSIAPALLRAGARPDRYEDLRAALAGDVHGRDDERYEIWRQAMIWQPLKTDRRPEVIVQAADRDDVVTAIRQAARAGIKVAVRTGGHSWCHSAVRDGGMLLDVSRLRRLDIDAGARSATVGPAVTGRELASALAAQGLAFPVPHCGTVPMGGYLLGGGMPWNGESWGGMACFSVEAVEIVTPQGEVIVADAANHPDWFWAARGAGPGFFGAVTQFRLRLYPLPRSIMTSIYTWPFTRLEDVLPWWTARAATLARQVESIFLIATDRKAAFPACAADPGGQVCLLSATAFADSEEQARSLLAPLAHDTAAAPCVIRSEYAPSPYDVLFDWDDASFPRERMAADTLWSNSAPSEIYAAIEEHFTRAPSPNTNVMCQLRPQPMRYPDAACSLRAPTYVAAYSNWTRAGDDDVNTRWLREAMTLMAPYAVGHYVNESDLTVSPERSIRSFSPDRWARLQALRRQYDPDGRFHAYLGFE